MMDTTKRRRRIQALTAAHHELESEEFHHAGEKERDEERAEEDESVIQTYGGGEFMQNEGVFIPPPPDDAHNPYPSWIRESAVGGEDEEEVEEGLFETKNAGSWRRKRSSSSPPPLHHPLFAPQSVDDAPVAPFPTGLTLTHSQQQGEDPLSYPTGPQGGSDFSFAPPAAADASRPSREYDPQGQHVATATLHSSYSHLPVGRFPSSFRSSGEASRDASSLALLNSTIAGDGVGQGQGQVHVGGGASNVIRSSSGGGAAPQTPLTTMIKGFGSGASGFVYAGNNVGEAPFTGEESRSRPSYHNASSEKGPNTNNRAFSTFISNNNNNNRNKDNNTITIGRSLDLDDDGYDGRSAQLSREHTLAFSGGSGYVLGAAAVGTAAVGRVEEAINSNSEVAAVHADLGGSHTQMPLSPITSERDSGTRRVVSETARKVLVEEERDAYADSNRGEQSDGQFNQATAEHQLRMAATNLSNMTGADLIHVLNSVSLAPRRANSMLTLPTSQVPAPAHFVPQRQHSATAAATNTNSHQAISGEDASVPVSTNPSGGTVAPRPPSPPPPPTTPPRRLLARAQSSAAGTMSQPSSHSHPISDPHQYFRGGGEGVRVGGGGVGGGGVGDKGVANKKEEVKNNTAQEENVATKTSNPTVAPAGIELTAAAKSEAVLIEDGNATPSAFGRHTRTNSSASEASSAYFHQFKNATAAVVATAGRDVRTQNHMTNQEGETLLRRRANNKAIAPNLRDGNTKLREEGREGEEEGLSPSRRACAQPSLSIAPPSHQQTQPLETQNQHPLNLSTTSPHNLQLTVPTVDQAYHQYQAQQAMLMTSLGSRASLTSVAAVNSARGRPPLNSSSSSSQPPYSQHNQQQQQQQQQKQHQQQSPAVHMVVSSPSNGYSMLPAPVSRQPSALLVPSPNSTRATSHSPPVHVSISGIAKQHISSSTNINATPNGASRKAPPLQSMGSSPSSAMMGVMGSGTAMLGTAAPQPAALTTMTGRSPIPPSPTSAHQYDDDGMRTRRDAANPYVSNNIMNTAANTTGTSPIGTSVMRMPAPLPSSAEGIEALHEQLLQHQHQLQQTHQALMRTQSAVAILGSGYGTSARSLPQQEGVGVGGGPPRGVGVARAYSSTALRVPSGPTMATQHHNNHEGTHMNIISGGDISGGGGGRRSIEESYNNHYHGKEHHHHPTDNGTNVQRRARSYGKDNTVGNTVTYLQYRPHQYEDRHPSAYISPSSSSFGGSMPVAGALLSPSSYANYDEQRRPPHRSNSVSRMEGQLSRRRTDSSFFHDADVSGYDDNAVMVHQQRSGEFGPASIRRRESGGVEGQPTFVPSRQQQHLLSHSPRHFNRVARRRSPPSSSSTPTLSHRSQSSSGEASDEDRFPPLGRRASSSSSSYFGSTSSARDSDDLERSRTAERVVTTEDKAKRRRKRNGKEREMERVGEKRQSKRPAADKNERREKEKRRSKHTSRRSSKEHNRDLPISSTRRASSDKNTTHNTTTKENDSTPSSTTVAASAFRQLSAVAASFAKALTPSSVAATPQAGATNANANVLIVGGPAKTEGGGSKINTNTNPNPPIDKKEAALTKESPTPSTKATTGDGGAPLDKMKSVPRKVETDQQKKPISIEPVKKDNTTEKKETVPSTSQEGSLLKTGNNTGSHKGGTATTTTSSSTVVFQQSTSSRGGGAGEPSSHRQSHANSVLASTNMLLNGLAASGLSLRPTASSASAGSASSNLFFSGAMPMISPSPTNNNTTNNTTMLNGTVTHFNTTGRGSTWEDIPPPGPASVKNYQPPQLQSTEAETNVGKEQDTSKATRANRRAVAASSPSSPSAAASMASSGSGGGGSGRTALASNSVSPNIENNPPSTHHTQKQHEPQKGGGGAAGDHVGKGNSNSSAPTSSSSMANAGGRREGEIGSTGAVVVGAGKIGASSSNALDVSSPSSSVLALGTSAYSPTPQTAASDKDGNPTKDDSNPSCANSAFPMTCAAATAVGNVAGAITSAVKSRGASMLEGVPSAASAVASALQSATSPPTVNLSAVPSLAGVGSAATEKVSRAAATSSSSIRGGGALASSSSSQQSGLSDKPSSASNYSLAAILYYGCLGLISALAVIFALLGHRAEVLTSMYNAEELRMVDSVFQGGVAVTGKMLKETVEVQRIEEKIEVTRLQLIKDMDLRARLTSLIKKSAGGNGGAGSAAGATEGANVVGQTPHSPIIERKGHQKETRERRAVQEQQDPIVTDGAGGILERPFCAETGQRPHVTERDAAEALRLQIRQVEGRMRNTTVLLTNYVNKRYETIEVLRRARDQQLDLIFVLSAFYYADAVLPPMLTREEEDAARAAAKTKEASEPTEALAPFEDEKLDNANVEGEALVDGPEAISSSSASKTRLEGSPKLAKKNLQNKAADQFQKGPADSVFSELSVRRRNEAEEENERNSADQYEDDRLHVSPYNRRKDSAKAEKEDDVKRGEGNKGVPHKTVGRRRTYDGDGGLSRVRGNGDGDVEDNGSHFEDDEEEREEEGQGSDDFSPEEAESLTLSSAFDEQNFPRRFARRSRKTPFRFSSSSPFPKTSVPHQLSRILGVWSPDDAFSMLRCQLCLQKGAAQFELLQKLTSTSSSAAGGVRRNRDGKRNADGDDNRSLNPTITKEPLPLDGTRIKNKGVDGPSDSSSFSSSFSSPLLSPPSLIDFLERQCAGVTHEEQQRVDEKGVIIHRKRGYASTSGGGGGGGSTAMGGTTQSLFPLYKLSSHAWSAAKNVLLLLTNRAENNSTEEGNETTTATPSSASSDSLGHSTESSKKSKTNNSNNNNIMRREPVCPVAIVSPCASSAAYYPNEHRTIHDDDLIRDPREAEGQARDRSPSWRASGSDRSGENGGGGRWVADPVVLFTKCATRVVAEEAAAESARKAFAEDYGAFISMSASAAKKGEVTGQDWERSKMGSTAAEKVPFGGVGRSNADDVNSVVTSATLAADSTASNNRKSAPQAETDSSFPSSSSSLSSAFGTSSPWAQSSSFVGSLLSSREDAESDLMRRIGNDQIAETAQHNEALATAYEETMKENENEKQQSDEKLQEYTKETAAALSTAFADAAARNGGVASMPPAEGGAAACSEEDVMVRLSHGLDTANSRSASATEDGPNVPVVQVPPQTVSPSSSPSSPAAGNGSLSPPKTSNHQKGSAVAEPIHVFIEGSEILLPNVASAHKGASPPPPTAATPDDLLLDPLYLAYLLSVTSTSSSSSISSAGRPIGAVLGNTPRTASSTSPPSSFAFSSTTQQPTTGNAIFTAPLSSSLNANDHHHQHLQQVLHFYYDPSSPHRPPMTFDSHSPSTSSFQSLFSSPAFYQLFSSAPHLSLSDSGDRKLIQRSRRRRRFDTVAPTLFSIRGGYPIEKALLEAASNILAGETAMMRMEEKLVTFLSRHEEKIKSEADAGKRKAEADAKREEEDRSEKQRVAAAEAEAEGRRLAAEKEKKAERKRRTREKRLERQRIKRDKENEAKEKEIKRAAELNTQHRHDLLHVDPAKAGATVTTAVANGESATSTLSPAVGESFMKEKAQAGDVKGQGEGEKEGRGDVIHTKDTSNREEAGRVVIRMSLLRLPLYAWYALTSPIVLNTARYSVWLPCELAVGAIRIAYYVSNFPFQLTSPTTNTTTSIGGNTVSPSSSSASGGGGGDTTSGGYLWCSAYLFPTPTASTRTAQATSAGVTSHKQGSADTKDESEDLEDDADEDTDADDRADREGDTETNMVAAANTALASSKKESLRSHTSEMMPSDMSSGAPLPADPPRSPPHSPPPHDTGPLTNASVRKRVQDTVGERRYSFELLMKDISDFFSTANLSKPCELLIALLGAKGSALVVMLISFAFLHYSRQY